MVPFLEFLAPWEILLWKSAIGTILNGFLALKLVQMQNFGQIQNGSIFRIFGFVRALPLKISHGDLKSLVILMRFSCAVYGQIMILLCDLWLCRLWAHCAFYGWLCGLWLLLCGLWLTVRFKVTVRFMGCTGLKIFCNCESSPVAWRGAKEGSYKIFACKFFACVDNSLNTAQICELTCVMFTWKSNKRFTWNKLMKQYIIILHAVA